MSCRRPISRWEWLVRVLTAAAPRGVRPDADSHQASGRSSPVARDLPHEAAPTNVGEGSKMYVRFAFM